MLIDGTTTDDNVYWQFLRSEMYKIPDHPEKDQLAALISRPDFDDIIQNYKRRRALFAIRWPLLAQLPNPLEWHRATLQLGDLEKLRLIGRCGWDGKARHNVLGDIQFPMAFDAGGQEEIANILGRITTPGFDKTMLLLAQNTDGPFTILDGNHRATAMMVAKLNGGFTEDNVKANIGVSPRMGVCYWCV